MKGGGNAFPTKEYSHADIDGNSVYEYKEGMTLRDYFAGQALIGLLAKENGPDQPHRIAYLCYEQADEMLRSRG